MAAMVQLDCGHQRVLQRDVMPGDEVLCPFCDGHLMSEAERSEALFYSRAMAPRGLVHETVNGSGLEFDFANPAAERQARQDLLLETQLRQTELLAQLLEERKPARAVSGTSVSSKRLAGRRARLLEELAELEEEADDEEEE